ncbi:SDR family NAD(P)-dependent oxidoreductase [Algoriphagus vanfongensis]|uniref:SDR family NAD(P)-dependent oxidoreductase n=1 Tax=Algoriphagus vanfongensis TaxID=426371 RepID=UPI00047A91D7|nr:SDR family oxidoreductase [Algoriphagus vanfongensis]
MNKTAIITGGSRGLGKNMALSLASRGIDVILTYHSNKEMAYQVVEEIEKLGTKAVAFQLDTSRVDAFASFLAQVDHWLQETKNTSNFDFLINNAGIGIYETIQNSSEDQFDSMVNIHLKGVYFLTQQAIPRINRGGRIINVSSGLARFSLPGYAAYAMMKGGIEVFTRYLAKELGEKGISANTLAPGAIETDFQGGAVRDNAQLNQHVSNSTALGRVGLPEDIGGVVAFLCSEEARWVNAQRIEVSGGQNI